MAEDQKIYTREEIEDKLSAKESIFCHKYVIEWNGADSARQAGYAEDSCRQAAYKLLTKDYIRQYVDYIRNDIERECNLSKIKAVKEWSKLAFSNITDILDIVKGNIPEELEETLEAGGDTVTLKGGIKALSELPREITDIISEIGQTKDGIKIKLYCKDNALKQLADLLGWNEAQKIQHSGEIKTEPKINLIVDGSTINLKEKN